MKTKTLTPEQALVRCEEMCARAEHCSAEIRRKLWQWGVRTEDADAILDSLVDRRFVDDARFAAAFVRDRAEYAGWGRRKIAVELIRKRIPRDLISDALGTIDEDAYKARLGRLIERKRASMPDSDTYEGRTKIFRYAAARGYEPDLISAILRQ